MQEHTQPLEIFASQKLTVLISPRALKTVMDDEYTSHEEMKPAKHMYIAVRSFADVLHCSFFSCLIFFPFTRLRALALGPSIDFSINSKWFDLFHI